jgi:hypothetical protein
MNLVPGKLARLIFFILLVGKVSSRQNDVATKKFLSSITVGRFKYFTSAKSFKKLFAVSLISVSGRLDHFIFVIMNFYLY